MIGVLAAPRRGWTHILAGSKSPTRQILRYGDGA
jgi:hypothetical protein